MFSQLSSNKLRLHTVTRLFWRNSAICNFTKKSDRQQSTSSIKGYTVFLSSFVLLSKKRKDRRKETHNLVVIKVIGCCVLLVSVFFFFLLLSTRNKKGEAKENTTQTNTAARRQHLTCNNKSSCVCTALFRESLSLFLHVRSTVFAGKPPSLEIRNLGWKVDTWRKIEF